MPYDFLHYCLTIYSRPKNYTDKDLLFEPIPIPPRYSKWISGWFKDILLEDYDGEFFNSSSGFGLMIPIEKVHPHIVEKLQNSNSFECVDVLRASANIIEDEFEITDCFIASYEPMNTLRK